MLKLIALLTQLAPKTYSKPPCQDAVDWLQGQPDIETAWNECERGDWLEWFLRRLTKHGTGRSYPQAITDGPDAVRKEFPVALVLALVVEVERTEAL